MIAVLIKTKTERIDFQYNGIVKNSIYEKKMAA